MGLVGWRSGEGGDRGEVAGDMWWRKRVQKDWVDEVDGNTWKSVMDVESAR